ncbi:MAG: hypothetical protein AABY58_09360 [Nitrospirota bacterium]
MQNKAKQRMPFDGKITVELKDEMTTAEPSNTIKVFYHPLSVVVNVEKAAGERYFFMEKPHYCF